jgi:hypothetical protein
MGLLPAGWTLVPITGQYVNLDGSPSSGRIYFKALQTIIIDGVVIVPITQFCILDGTGSIPAGFALPATNDPAILAGSGFGYQVTENHCEGRAPYWIAVDYEATSIDLVTAAPIVPPPQLVSTQGLSAYQIALANGYVGTQAQWLASLQGPPGPSASQSFNMVAQIALDSPRVVSADANGLAYYPDLSNPADVAAIVGVTTAGGAAGSNVPVISGGEISELFWNWTPGLIFCAEAGGTLTQTPADSAYVPVAAALGQNNLIVSLKMPTMRAT